MFTEEQLEILKSLEAKWKMWERTKVSLFTYSDNLEFNIVREAMGLPPANFNCHACFIEEIKSVMAIYRVYVRGKRE